MPKTDQEHYQQLARVQKPPLWAGLWGMPDQLHGDRHSGRPVGNAICGKSFAEWLEAITWLGGVLDGQTSTRTLPGTVLLRSDSIWGISSAICLTAACILNGLPPPLSVRRRYIISTVVRPPVGQYANIDLLNVCCNGSIRTLALCPFWAPSWNIYSMPDMVLIIWMEKRYVRPSPLWWQPHCTCREFTVLTCQMGDSSNYWSVQPNIWTKAPNWTSRPKHQVLASSPRRQFVTAFIQYKS